MTSDLDSLSGKTFLITGAAGMLGRGFVEALGDVEAATILACSHDDLDVTTPGAVLALADFAPDFIIHCAADVNAERCERDPGRCHEVQVGGTVNIADLAAEVGAQVLYPQSFLIFDGKEIPIIESTEPAPLSVYGRCKLEAERQLRARVADAVAVRMAGFFGGDEKDKNFVGKFVNHICGLIGEGVGDYAVGDRVWQPTYTLDLARNSLLLLASGGSGVYNMSSHGEASFFELAVACVEELGLARRMTITETTEANVAGDEKARRPTAGIMENRRLAAEGLDRQRPWREALAEYLKRPYFKRLIAELPVE